MSVFFGWVKEVFVCSPIAREGKAIKWPRKQFEGSRVSTRDLPRVPSLAQSSRTRSESQLLFASPLKQIGRIHRSFLLGAENVCSTSGLVFFQSSSIFIPLKVKTPNSTPSPKKEAKHLLMLRFPKPAPPHQTNKTNKTRHFLGFTKNRVEWKPPFHQVYGAADPFTPSEATPEAMDIHLGPGRLGDGMVRVRWLKGWRVGDGDGRRGWEIKQKTLGGWRLRLNFGCLMLYLPQNGWWKSWKTRN